MPNRELWKENPLPVTENNTTLQEKFEKFNEWCKEIDKKIQENQCVRY